MNIVTLLAALEFAADKHRNQRRKDIEESPYVNHLIAVTHILAAEGGVDDEATLLAALLHDTVEDTDTTFEELDARFGSTVAALVREVTDDKGLTAAVRKQRQIDHVRDASVLAKQLKIADKIANIRDIVSIPPAHWTGDRKLEYFAWAEQVVAGCRGINRGLEQAFDEVVAMGRAREEDVATFADFIGASSWRFAKTYVESYPHEYTLAQPDEPDRFRTAIACIERWGVLESFWKGRRRYLYVDGTRYWHMGDVASADPQHQPTLINRTWLDVGRYRDNARALGYDDAAVDTLVVRWESLLKQAKRGRAPAVASVARPG